MRPTVVKTVDRVAALQAAAMPSTARVGDPSEDASMAAARPMLAKINALGFVTVDSQMGLSGGPYRQRAYISGFVSKARAAGLMAELTRRDLVAVQYPHGEDTPADLEAFGLRSMPRLALTDDGGEVHTKMPLGAAQTWKSMWRGLLPELGLQDDTRSMQAVRADAVQVFVADVVWGRKTWLFRQVHDALARV